MLSFGDLGGDKYYFGLQTDVSASQAPFGRGKGLIFSRWGTKDLSNARAAVTDGWAVSSAGESGFISVRRTYDWGEGSYLVKLASDTSLTAPDGKWYGLWITDIGTGVTTWAGSLKFSPKNNTTLIGKQQYSTVEVYGYAIKPIDIPSFQVSIERPIGDGVPASSGHTSYSHFSRKLLNAEVHYDRDSDVVRFETGEMTTRQTEGGAIEFE